jgi:hypothetical protein
LAHFLFLSGFFGVRRQLFNAEKSALEVAFASGAALNTGHVNADIVAHSDPGSAAGFFQKRSGELRAVAVFFEHPHGKDPVGLFVKAHVFRADIDKPPRTGRLFRIVSGKNPDVIVGQADYLSNFRECFRKRPPFKCH